MCLKFKIYGRVQGIGFRWSVQRKAEELGLVGYAKNMPDGSVEVLACGDSESIDELIKWFDEDSPSLSKISKVKRTEVNLDALPVTFDTM